MPHPFPSQFDPDVFEAGLRALERRAPFQFPEGAVPSSFRRSSVLVAFWREGHDLKVLLTKRAETLSGHPGQMSFPGGKLEPGESWTDGALRETEEEVGIPRDTVEVLGRLDDAWSGAGHLLVPIVGWLPDRPTTRPNPAEVAEIHMPSVRGLLAPEAYSEEEARLGDEVYSNPILEWETGRLFGLSTDLLIEALRLASGIDTVHGRERLASLHSYLRMKAATANESDRG